MLFSDLKPKQKSFLTEISYQNVLAEYVLGMLEYPNMPVEIEYVRYLDFLLLRYGQAALFKSSYWGRWVIGDVVFVGVDLNEYGILPDAIVHDRAGHEQKFTDWQNSQECFVFFNNRNHTPDINIPRYADLLSKIDISLNANIVNSRMSPIVVARDQNVANQIKAILEQNHDGHTETVTSSGNILNDQDELTIVNITDVNASDKIQYLLHAKDDLTREFLNIYGLHITGTGKMAQQSIEEITGSNNAALVIPYEMMKARNDTLNRFNAITGLNVVCQFSESWQREEQEAELSAPKAGLFAADSDFAEPAKSPVEEQDETEPEEIAPDETAPEQEEQTVAEEIAEQAEEGLTIEAQANTLPIDEETGRREIEENANNGSDSIPDESSASDPS